MRIAVRDWARTRPLIVVSVLAVFIVVVVVVVVVSVGGGVSENGGDAGGGEYMLGIGDVSLQFDGRNRAVETARRFVLRFSLHLGKWAELSPVRDLRSAARL